MSKDRRTNLRIPIELPIIQFIDNRPIRSLISNLSATGLHSCHAVEPMSRSSRVIQIEFPLPGVAERLWAKAEVVYDTIGPCFHGTGVRFIAIANAHQRLLDEWIRAEAGPSLAAVRCSPRSLRI
jgi:hypothetical protein